jgi:hypothetical protein
MEITPIEHIRQSAKIEKYQADVKEEVKDLPIQSNDTVTFSPESLQFTKYVDMVKSLPDERQSVIDDFKERVKHGVYPPPEIIDGLTKLLGTNIKR